MSIKRTGGNWSPPADGRHASGWPCYFVASETKTLAIGQDCLQWVLCAVNELRSPAAVEDIRSFIRQGKHVFIDSGVFHLANSHARHNAMRMDAALALAPDQIDGFGELFERYVALLSELGDKVWGYIEIDQGGRENKIKTRARLEALGLAPIPVYHPFNDGWDYFDYLAARYDRICLGNVVQADPATRKRLVATIWERRRRYPHLWIHALGLTASELVAAYPVNSCDSSTWISGVRWGTHNAHAGGKRVWETGGGFTYAYDAEPDAPNGHKRARLLAAYDAAMMNRQMITMAAEAERALDCAVGAFHG